MAVTNTTGGCGPRPFPSTIWEDVLAAGDPARPGHRERLEELLRTYWKPVFAYIRTVWGKPVEDSKDLTQEFFTRLLEKEYLGRLRPEIGSFRGYLKQALKHFLIDASRAQKSRRPPGTEFSLNVEGEILDQTIARNESPEEAYDREWRRVLLDDSLRTLRRRLVGEGKQVYADVLWAYVVDPGPPDAESRAALPTYATVAGRLGLGEGDVRNYLNFSRNLLRSILMERIREYTTSAEEADLEIRGILGG